MASTVECDVSCQPARLDRLVADTRCAKNVIVLCSERVNFDRNGSNRQICKPLKNQVKLSKVENFPNPSGHPMSSSKPAGGGFARRGCVRLAHGSANFFSGLRSVDSYRVLR